LRSRRFRWGGRRRRHGIRKVSWRRGRFRRRGGRMRCGRCEQVCYRNRLRLCSRRWGRGCVQVGWLHGRRRLGRRSRSRRREPRKVSWLRRRCGHRRFSQGRRRGPERVRWRRG
jgi:hypothetical protein